MAEVTKGTVTSEFPDSQPDFTAQSEAKDPASTDDTLAEGKDANKWSAEIQAICETLGTGGRGSVSASGATATVEKLDYVYQGTQYSYPGTVSLGLTINQINYIYLDLADNTAKVSTTSWPSSPHLRLGKWDDSGPSSVLTNERSHDLEPAEQKQLYSTAKARVADFGTATILNGNASVDISFGISFTSTPYFFPACHRGADASTRKVNFSNLTTTGARIHVDVAAPASGITIHWQAVGLEAIGS